MMNLLITGIYKWKDEQIEALKKLGWNVVLLDREDSDLTFDPAIIDAVICNWLFVHHDIHKFINLKYIQLLSAGLDRVPLEYVREKGIHLYNARGVYSIPMAEYAVCGVLQLLKDSRGFADKQCRKSWEKNRNIFELNGRTVCIIGTGSVGTECARRFKAFTEDVYGIDLNVRDDSAYKKIYPISDLKNVLVHSDIVVLTLPLTAETKGMFNRDLFSIMKQGAIFVNIARGQLVAEDDLMEALNSNLLGAVLDVFQTEPLPQDSTLWEKNNVIITPHNSFVSERNDERMWILVLDNIRKYSNLIESTIC